MLAYQKRVIRTERIWIKPNKQLTRLCHLSKNLFNEANYIIRQTFFNEGELVRVYHLQQELQTSKNFLHLPEPIGQRILKILETTWKSFFRALADWKKHPEKYFQRPQVPKYKRKDGQFLLSLSKYQIKYHNGVITLPSIIGVKVKTRLPISTQILGARIVPKGVGYVIEILYFKQVPVVERSDPVRIVGIDIGLNNLITMTNNIGKKPIVIKGGVVKSINQYYNKERARQQGVYDKQGITTGKKLCRITDKRNRKINHYFHEVSCFIIYWCKKNKIDTIIIGRNKLWKQCVNLGKRGNQNFVAIPFNNLIHKIRYKAQDAGMVVVVIREDYTSKCSFLDQESIAYHSSYVGERITRGLFQTSTGKLINSDVNGSYNIIKKAVPNAFSQWETADGIEGVWLHPVRWKAIGQLIV